MAALSGKSGLVLRKGVPVFRINNWSLDVDVDMRDHTSFTTGTLQWRTFLPGLSGWSGTFSGFWDAQGSTAQKDAVNDTLTPSTGTILLHADKVGGDALTGNSFISGLSAGAAVDDDVTISFDFQGTDALSYTTTT